jgi:hypothetical protein
LATRSLRIPRTHPKSKQNKVLRVTTITGKPFYITSSRYRSMVTDYIVPMEKTFTLLGPPKTSLQQGVNETTTWLQTQNPNKNPTT